MTETTGLADPVTPPLVPSLIQATNVEYEIIKVPDLGEEGRDPLKQLCFDLRIAVFTHEQGFPLEDEIDQEDETATHFLLRLLPTRIPAGTVRCVKVRIKDPVATNGQLSTQSSPSSAAITSPDPGATQISEELCQYYYKLGRLVVLKEYRKYRLGKALVLALHDWVVQDAAAQLAAKSSLGPNDASSNAGTSINARTSVPTVRIVSHSQIPVKAFYARYGYVPEGPEFIEDGAPHQKMVLDLPIPMPSGISSPATTANHISAPIPSEVPHTSTSTSTS